MTPERFQELLDTYGSDLCRWPRGFRADAQALLSSSPAARQAMEDAQAVEADLREKDGQQPAASPSRDALIDRIMSAIDDEPEIDRDDPPSSPARPVEMAGQTNPVPPRSCRAGFSGQLAAFCLACAIVGFITGFAFDTADRSVPASDGRPPGIPEYGLLWGDAGLDLLYMG